MPYDSNGAYYFVAEPLPPPLELDELDDDDDNEADDSEPEPEQDSSDDGSEYETRTTPIVPTKLREYRADAAKILGFFPPVTAYEPSTIQTANKHGRLRPLEWGEMLQIIAHDKTQKAALQPEPYFGVELEVYARRSVKGLLAAFHEIMGRDVWLIFKYDGSLSSGGVEIVTAPMTLEQHQTRWPLMQEVLRAQAKGWKQHQAGLHVHVSRKTQAGAALSKLHVAKMINFVHCWRNTTFLEALGGRKADTYAKFESPKIPFKPKFTSGDRREALNITKTETLELRFFASTTKVERILMAVEFTSCLRGFTQDASIPQSSDLSGFITYAKSHRHTYPNLNEYIQHVLRAKFKVDAVGECAMTTEEQQALADLCGGTLKLEPELSIKDTVRMLTLMHKYQAEVIETHGKRRFDTELRYLEKRLDAFKTHTKKGRR